MPEYQPRKRHRSQRTENQVSFLIVRGLRPAGVVEACNLQRNAISSFTSDVELRMGRLMADAKTTQGSPTFKMALGVFGALGFVQLMAVGTAYTRRAGVEKEVVKYRESPVVVLKEYVETEVPAEPEVPVQVLQDADQIVNRVLPYGVGSGVKEEVESPVLEIAEVNIKPATSNYDYVVKHPKVEKLLFRAKDAYVMGDMGAAVVRVEEARELDPGEPAVIDMLAQIAEGMGAYDKAKNLYLNVFQMGVEAGPYYKRAASKIEKGVGRRFEDGAFMQLGALNIIRSSTGRDSKVVIPIRAKEGEFIVGEQVEIQVHFYDVVNGEKIEPAAKNAQIISSWQNAKVDWNSRKIETLEVQYKVPVVDEVEQHLYGVRKYHGQVVELYYKGDIQDVVAHPRALHKVHADKNLPKQSIPDTLPFEFLDNFNENNPLLPEKPR